MENNNKNCVWYLNHSLSLGALPKLFKSFENYLKFKIIQNFRIDCFCMNTFSFYQLLPLCLQYGVNSVEVNDLRCSIEWFSSSKSQKLMKGPTMKFAWNCNKNQTPSQVYLSYFCKIFKSTFLKNTFRWQLTSALHCQGGK